MLSAARIRGFLKAVFREFREAEEFEHVDLDTGEISRPQWPPGQRFRLNIQHSNDCESHWHDATEGFTCNCSPEVCAEAVRDVPRGTTNGGGRCSVYK